MDVGEEGRTIRPRTGGARVGEGDPAGATWPPIAFEEHPWELDPGVSLSRRRLRAACGPYTAAVPPSIAPLDVVLPSGIAAEAEDAARLLTRFDAEVGRLPAPLSSILLRTESASSSEVEHITASARQIALAELNVSASSNARLVVANTRAMEAALRLADRMDRAAILDMHAALLGESQPSIVGRWRDQQVWVGGGSESPHLAQFVPPHHDRVPDLMADLEEFVARADVPSIAHIAIAHAQFETVHPFPDGNGRTGRALAQAMLRAEGLATQVTVPVSAGLLGDLDGYVRALNAYREGDLVPIVQAFVDSVFRALANGQRLADDLAALETEWSARVRARANSAASRLGRVLQSHPVLSVEVAAAELGVGFQAANAAIAQYEAAGVVRLMKQQRRNRLWQVPEVLGALDAFAERARRGRVA